MCPTLTPLLTIATANGFAVSIFMLAYQFFPNSGLPYVFIHVVNFEYDLVVEHSSL